jgi:hypothetical protein
MLVHDLTSDSSIVVKYSMSNPETEGSNPVATPQQEIGEDKITFVHDLISSTSPLVVYSTSNPEIDGLNLPPAQHQEHAEEKHLFRTRSVAVAH